MKALIYQGPGKITVEERHKPVIKKPSDAVVKIKKLRFVEQICIF